MGTVKQKALVYGNGNTYLKNICWIRQLYDIVGITDSKCEATCKEEGIYKVEDAVGLAFDIILVASVFFDEIKDILTEKFCVDERKICWFLDEFSNERHETFGEKNPDITFYVFRAHWQEHKNGFYNFYDRVIASCYKARQMGYELVVDMKNYYTEYAGLERYGAVNVWEDYYEQPSQYTLDDAYQSKNVVLSRFDEEEYNYPKLSPCEYLSNKWNSEVYEKLGKMFRFTPSPMLQKNIDEDMGRLNMSGKVLGVLARGTDYITLKPKDHSIPYDIDLLIAECQSMLAGGEYSHIYLATEDLDFLEKFQNVFGERLLYTGQMRMRHSDNIKEWLMDIEFDRENDGYLRGLEYCTVIEVLARCDSLLANSCCYGSLGAIAINGGRYGSHEILDAGTYD